MHNAGEGDRVWAVVGQADDLRMAIAGALPRVSLASVVIGACHASALQAEGIVVKIETERRDER